MIIERIIAVSIRHRGLVILAGFALAAWGAYAAWQTPIDAVPDLSENQVIVFTDWPGHSPQEIEDQVTYPLSVNLQGLEGVRAVRGSSDLNFSMIHLIFEDGTTFADVRTRVQERLALTGDQLPAGVVPRLAPDAIATGQIFWYTVEGRGYDLGRLRSIQDWYVRHQLQAVPGVAEVASVGGQVVEYHVSIDPARMQARGVALRDLLEDIARSNAAAGGHVIHKGTAEYIVRGVGWLGARAAGEATAYEPHRVLHDIENIVVRTTHGDSSRVADVATVSLGAQPRRGLLEKDGSEVTGGVVLMRYGHNPLEVTRRIKEKLLELEPGLPPGVRIVPCYDRTPLIEGAVRTVTGTLAEAMLTATVCVVLILLHLRTSFIIAVTLPLSALASFAIMWSLRRLGIADIQTNVMSLAGIAISIGVLVDSSIVMAENAMFHVQQRFGDRPVEGDIRLIVLPACCQVGRPIFFSVLIMLVSFLPVFALRGLDGKMFHPLAFTKTFALVSVAVLSITLVPALCTIFIKGRLRTEQASWVVRSVIGAYRPVLSFLLDRPAPLVWLLGLTFVVGVAPLGMRWVSLATLFLALVVTGLIVRRPLRAGFLMASLVITALVAEQSVRPLGTETRLPLDEGMVMDMPISVPGASIVQSGNDLKARDMVLCRFPEVGMVVGKAGRAESPFDPAPLDMIETMIEFRPRELWPKRKLYTRDAERQARDVLDALLAAQIVAPPANEQAKQELLNEATMAAVPRFDGLMREFCYQRHQEFNRTLSTELVRFAIQRVMDVCDQHQALLRSANVGDVAMVVRAVPPELSERLVSTPGLAEVTAVVRQGLLKMQELGLMSDSELPAHRPHWLASPLVAVQRLIGQSPPMLSTVLHTAVETRHRALWRAHLSQLNRELLDRGAAMYTRVISEELRNRAVVIDARAVEIQQQIEKARRPQPKPKASGGGHHDSLHGPLPIIDPHPALDKLHADLTRRLSAWVLFWPCERQELAGFGGELDAALQMPGWANVWTMPIQNRVDMLATGVNTEIGVRVLGRELNQVVSASEEIAACLREIPGAADVIADPIRGKGYLEIHPDREKAAELGVSIGDINDVIETALGGKVATTVLEGRERHDVRVRYTRAWSLDEQTVRNLPIPARNAEAVQSEAKDAVSSPARFVPLSQVATVRITEGPATIKSENGLLRNYVRLNVRGVSPLEFVNQAQRNVAERVRLPEGTFIEWTGQFEHTLHTLRTLWLLMPAVLGLIFLILYLTFRDLADAGLMLLTVPGALVGGIIFQWLFGYSFSVPVGVGYIVCFGMATETGIIMLVYLREAVERASLQEPLTPDRLRQAVLDGAVHRLRPKLLTEATTILGLAPMLWAGGVGSEVIRPMAAPVLGGILIADEIIDLLLPIMFYKVRRWRLGKTL